MSDVAVLSATQRSRTLIIACFATFLVLVNFTAPVSTVQLISTSLGAGPSGQTWILGGISVGLATFLLVTGSIADDHGRKRIFLAGGGLLAVSEVVCAVAPDTVTFVAGRIVQGAASAAILAVSLGLLGHVFPPGAERVRATGLWGAMIGAGIAVGPVYSAVLEFVAPWQWAYWLLGVMAGGITVVAAFWLDESRAEQRRHVDVAGVLTLGAGIAVLVSGLTESRGGWGQPHVVALLVAGVALLAGFVAVERRTADPMLDFDLLRDPSFRAATLGAFTVGVAVIGIMTYVPIAAQRVLGLGPLAGAGILAIWSGLSFVVAPQTRRLVRFLGGRLQVAAGLAMCGVGELALIGISTGSSWWRFVPGLALAGLGSGMANAALAGLAVQSVPAGRTAMGSGANNTARYLGSSTGVALIASVLAVAPAHGEPAAEFTAAMTRAAVMSGLLAIVGALAVAACRPTTRA